LPFNATAREEYDSKVDKALQVATTKVVLDAYLHLPTLSKIRSVREVILQFLPDLDVMTKVRHPRDRGILPEKICVELSAFHDWAMLEQYQVPDTLSRYVRDAQRLFTHASAISQAEKLADIIKRFLPRFDEMSQQYLPPEGKTLPEDSLLKLNAYLTWVKEEEITTAALGEQHKLLINALYLCCRSRFALFGAASYGEEIYNSVYYLPMPNELNLIPHFKVSIAAAICNTNRQDCLLDLVSAAFPNFMTFSLNPVSKQVSDNYPREIRSSPSSLLAFSPSPKEASPPPPPPLPLSLVSAPKLRPVKSGDGLMLVQARAIESERIRSLKQAAGQAASINVAVARLKNFLDTESPEEQTERLSKLDQCTERRSYVPALDANIMKNRLAEIQAKKSNRKIEPLTNEQLDKKRQIESDMRVKDAVLAIEKGKKEGLQSEDIRLLDPVALAALAELRQQTNQVLSAFQARVRSQHESDSESDQNDEWSDSGEDKMDEEFARLTLRN
jgi:hypothetical protein